jgi:glutathione S-transferase
MLTLYFSPGKSSMAAHIGLHEIGQPFESIFLDFSKRQHKEPAYLALNPEGKVPTLTIDGRPITEVAGILYYLAKQYPKAVLMPQNNPELEAQVISWMSFIASSVHGARQGDFDHRLKVFKIADGRLGQKPWAIGDSYSIADIHLFRLYWRFLGPLDKAPDTLANLNAHYARMMARPAVKRTIEIESALGYDLRP